MNVLNYTVTFTLFLYLRNVHVGVSVLLVTGHRSLQRAGSLLGEGGTKVLTVQDDQYSPLSNDFTNGGIFLGQ